jgi:CubicO group peptidase (beta-lactamase class C family)
MFTPYVTGTYGGTGYGWFLRTMSDGQPRQSHSGSGAGFRAWNYRLPQSGLTVVVLSNVGDPDASWVVALLEAVAKASE